MASTSRHEYHVHLSDPAGFADQILSDTSGLSKSRIKVAMSAGAVWLSRGRKTVRLRRAKKTLRSGDQLHLYYDESIISASSPVPTLVHDAGGYSVWDKPCRVLSQGSKWGDKATVARYAEQHLKPARDAFIVHRLDRAASGLILIAHGKKAAANLSALFRERQVMKRYRVIVHGSLSNDAPIVIDHPLDGKAAITRVQQLWFDQTSGHAGLDVFLITGRKHQIRRHLAYLGHPVVGDRLYGHHDATQDLQLRAYLLNFQCPLTGTERTFEVDPVNGPTP